MIKKIDHMVITTAKPKETIEFYEKLGFKIEDSGSHYQVFAGDFKLNVHIQGQELLPHAGQVCVGSGDFCFEVADSIESMDKLADELTGNGLDIEIGPVSRNGTNGSMKSIYLRDPNGNLIELSKY